MSNESNRYNKEELDSAYEKGRNAYHAGLDLANNEFDEAMEGELHHKWSEGFLEAEEDDTVLVEEDEQFILGDPAPGEDTQEGASQ
jgi:hypothetical protein